VETPVYYVVTRPVFVSAVEAPIVGVSSPEALAAATADASTSPDVPTTAQADAGALEQGAWEALGLGEMQRAEELFAMVLNREPDNARARAGYGLAAALAGREATAAWALRDAIALRPDVLDALPLTSEVRWQLTELARHLETRTIDVTNGGDALFLTAALRASVGDRAQAAYAMELAARLGPLDDVRTQFRSRLAAQLR